MLRTVLALVMLALVMVSGASADTKVAVKTDYDNLCNAPERSGAAKIKNKQQRIETLVKYLQRMIKTEEVKKMLASIGSLAPADRAPTLKSAAAKAGYTGPCPMADEK